ncbi:hypothetical protein V6N13_066277 [Hibiscus sabdariffa]|uniref:Uncharacterized protein n=1 Tax=Hibiscus sabdariffa TaxID=183260 RepID=A0ABR2DPY9_9ROSI
MQHWAWVDEQRWNSRIMWSIVFTTIDMMMLKQVLGSPSAEVSAGFRLAERMVVFDPHHFNRVTATLIHRLKFNQDKMCFCFLVLSLELDVQFLALHFFSSRC